ncbi:aspartyl/asparaginyl beta-hydroxylase domain-containing protein [Pseudokordiimonas caeni]|uniref:aspartyl/asparaginyl beta-hydroxylase domain-containing protein n=1 Tax=Pseudokordiimonas caeni TaxID=2997908 RepID=UPI002811C098|nr:aspartyl/asparaginyl beta-hydroxylase domain-containing protein [Pseudokordiimonas caeni]
MANIPATAATHLRSAADARASGNPILELQHIEAAMKDAPGHPVVMNSRGIRALADREFGLAADCFRQAAEADSGAPALWLNLATAARGLKDTKLELEALDHILRIDQADLMANIRRAEVHEILNETSQALRYWSQAIAIGSATPSPSPMVQELLKHGRQFVATQQSRLTERLDNRFHEMATGQGIATSRRMQAAVDVALGRRRVYHNECHGLHFPFLPEDEFFERHHFPWMEEIERHTPAIRAELESLLTEGMPGARPYVRMDPGTPRNKWSDLDNSERWNAYFLWHHGTRVEEACARCPATAAALDAVPRSTIPGRAPTAFFSLLAPKSKIPPHTGVTNTRAIVHLPLIVPAGCAFRVGGETRPWVEGEAFAFDDTIEHEAWNDSDELRAVLIFDVWNPHLTTDEQALLSAFFEEGAALGISTVVEA